MCDSIVILNLSAAIKILLALTVGVLGIVYVSRNGFVNDMSGRDLPARPSTWTACRISPSSSSTFLGFEVVCTYAGSMADPRRQIPQAIVAGGIVIAAIYLFLRLRHRSRRPYPGHQCGLRPHRRRVP